MDLNALLARAVSLGASDIHLKLGRPPMVRRDGEVGPIEGTEPLTDADLDAALRTVTARVSPDVAAMTDGMALYRKRGCPRCNQSGYRGRIGVYQLMVMSEELETLAAQKAAREEIERAAMAAGMRTLWDDGLAKVAVGLTSVEELARVTV